MAFSDHSRRAEVISVQGAEGQDSLNDEDSDGAALPAEDCPVIIFGRALSLWVMARTPGCCDPCRRTIALLL